MPTMRDSWRGFHFTAPREMHLRMKVAAALQDTSVASLIRDAVEKHLLSVEELDFLKGRKPASKAAA